MGCTHVHVEAKARETEARAEAEVAERLRGLQAERQVRYIHCVSSYSLYGLSQWITAQQHLLEQMELSAERLRLQAEEAV